MPDENRNFQLDYEQTTAYFHALAETRFKLLALLPIASGTALIVLDPNTRAPLTLAVGLLGFLASFGLLVYDQRNTELYDRMQRRAKILEAELGFVPYLDEDDKKEWSLGPADVKLVGGAFLDRPRRGRKFYGLPLWHDFGLALVYSATLAGWAYLIGSAIVQRLGWSTQRAFGFAALIGALTFVGLMRLDDPTDEQTSLPVRYRKRVWQEPDSSSKKNSSLLSPVLGGGGIGVGTGLLVVNNPLIRIGVGLIVGILAGVAAWLYEKRQ
jgi:hypothetical protein